jgi:hypothetical protein
VGDVVLPDEDAKRAGKTVVDFFGRANTVSIPVQASCLHRRIVGGAMPVLSTLFSIIMKYLSAIRAAFVVVLLAGIVPVVYAQNTPSSARVAADAQESVPADLKSITAGFFSLVVAGDVQGAFAELLKNSAIASNTDQVQNLVEQTKRTVSLYGEVKGYELVSADKLGTSVVRLRYLALHREFPVRWILTYYKSPVKGWLLTNIKFDDRVEELFPDE